MALENKGFKTPPPIEPRGPSIPRKSSPFKKGGLPGKTGNIIREQFISPLGQALGNVIRGPKIPQKKADKVTEEKKQGVGDLLIHGLKASKEKQKTAKKERRVGAMDIFLGLTPQKEKKAISPKKKSSLFGKKEKAIKYQEFEKFLKDPSLYRIDKLSPHQRRKKWKEIFKKTGTGYLKRWKVRKYFKDRAFSSPKTRKEVIAKGIDKIYEKKFLEK